MSGGEQQLSGGGQQASGPARQIPVVVLAGFLGVGKTTLLNHLLRGSGGTRVGVVVNDFGAIEIDAMSVSGQVGSTVSLGNGCLCCAVDGSELDAYLEKLTHPSVGLDVIVIEASGLAEPQELVRMLLASENPYAVYGGLVEVVDAAEFEATRERHPELERHLALADLIVLNKVDRINAEALGRLRDAIAGAGATAAVVEASYGRIDPELLFERRPSTERIGQLSFDDVREEVGADGEDGEGWEQGGHEGHEGHESRGGHGAGHEGHLHAAYETVSFEARTPMSPRRLLDFLDARPQGLYRIKGFIDFGDHDRRNRYALHAVGRFLRFTPEPWGPGQERCTQLVLIGAGVDTAALTAGLERCRDDVPQDVRPEAMWGVLRFVRQDGSEEAELVPEAGQAVDAADGVDELGESFELDELDELDEPESD
ncbi:GTP-binding protein [Streptomyces sp. TRM66268-LWL]|uniref:GTP-binding protein n=1 Tax=Streptomyces polyasparticus TaxID=2767826 RepID=A0ABR7SUB7_9ACTN|nr:CobW family GTP-binding protein [Streptomyces polyasparticus]MBC9718389.1 GTP-binding protein [Streptomyces polyasparticus]